MLAIIADDLTGALDSAAPFAGRGLHTEVALCADAVAEALTQAPAVISINLGSREITADAARDAMAAALAALPAGTRLFKKVDSRLKGHIAAELDALPFTLALVAPAIPEFSRVVQSGCVTGFGVEAPISVAERLGRHAPRALVPDISSTAEMDAALEDAERAGADLLIGARGLAEALARRMTGKQEAALAPVGVAMDADLAGRNALFVIGSRDPITLAQIDDLRQSMQIDFVAAPNGAICDPSPPAGPIILVQATPGELVDGAQALAPLDVSDRLAAGVVPRFTQMASTLVLSGGATAEAVLHRMKISRLRLMGECMPGLGLAYAEGQCIIAKSGGFGNARTLRDLAAAIVQKME